MKFEIRYARSFLKDLRNLEPASRERVYCFVFIDFMQLQRLHDLPKLRQIGSQAIFYRFSLDNYLIAIEVTGQIIKFIRLLPKPDI